MQKFSFTPKKDCFLYETKILNNQFVLKIKIKNLKEIETELVDISNKELYTLHLISYIEGSFVGSVREEYEKILNSIAQNCCDKKDFTFEQTNRLENLIELKYNVKPEFLWEKTPDAAVFRNPESKKWFAIVMGINKSKLDKNSSSNVEILNVKLDENEIKELQKIKGFYLAYHMNKKTWITILLDESVSDDKIMELIEKSYNFSKQKR